MGNRHSAFREIGFQYWAVVQGSENILTAEGVSRTDGRHDLFSDGSTFGNMLERTPGCKINSRTLGPLEVNSLHIFDNELAHESASQRNER